MCIQFNFKVTDIEKAYVNRLISKRKGELLIDGSNIFIFDDNLSVVLDKRNNNILVKDFIIAQTMLVA